MLRLSLLLTCLLAAFATTGMAHEQGRHGHGHGHGKQRHPHSRPSPSPSSMKREIKRAIIPVTVALGAPEDLARCPEGTMACPIATVESVSDEYECLDPKTELYSCGGCASLATGQDCTVIPNALSIACEVGACQVYTCETGFIPNNAGTGCVPGFATEVVLQNRRARRARKH